MIEKREGARQRRSSQGEAILEELKTLVTHPRGDELYAIVRRRVPKVSLGTVYRNLDRLQREGKALEIYCGDFVRYDGNVSPHDHFLCRRCRRVWDFDGGDSPNRADAGGISPTGGFQIDGRYTMFLGTCPDCLARSREAADLE